MVDSTSTEQEQVQLQQISTSFRPDLNSAARTTFGVPEAPVGDTAVIPEQVDVQDIRTTSPAPTENDLRTPNMELERVVNEELPSAWEAIKVGIAPTGRDWWASYKDSKRFERDPLFNPKEGAEKFFQEHGMLSETENQYLNKAVRYEDLEYRKQKVLEKRVDDKITAARPWITGAAGLIDIDILTALAPPVYGAAKVGTTAKVTARTAQAVAAGTGATLTNQALGNYSTRTEDERDMDTVMFGLAGFLTDVNRVQKATTAPTRSVTAPPSTPVPPQVTFTPVTSQVGLGVNTQTAANLPKHVQASLAQATVQVATNLKPVSKPKGAPTEWFKKYPMLSKLTSSADELWMYTQGDQRTVVNKLLSNVHTEGDNVASAQASYLNNYGYALASVEQALADAVPEITNVSSNLITRTTGKYGEASQEVMDMFQDSMQKLDQAVVDYANKNNGAVLSDDGIKALADMLAVPDAMKHVLKTYVDSGFATKIYDDAAANGFFEKAGMDAILRRPTYMPLQHNYERMHNLVRDGKATWDDVYDFYGTQIARIYPELLQPNFAKAGRTHAAVKQGANTATTAPFILTVKQIGEHFVQTQRQTARGLSDVTTSGMGKETLHDMLTRAGISSTDAAKAVDEIFTQQAQKQSNPKNLRKRMSWDWNYKMTASTGEVLDLGKLTGGSVYGNVEAYSRRMAHLNGLAQYGLSEQTLKELLEGYLDKLPDGVSAQRAKSFMEKVSDDLVGKPTGGDVSQSIRTMQAIADPMLLANSGLFGLMDLATQTMRVGLIRSFPHIYKGLKAAFTGMKGMSKENAKDLEEIFTGKAMQGSRWKNFITHYSDNFAVEGGGIHDSARYYGQSARFMNLSESVKRVQLGILMGTYIRALRGAADGVERHVNFLRTKMQMPDELIDGIRTEWAKHGEKIDDWDAAVRIPMEQKVFHESDNLAYTIQKGEIPAILEHDAVGKVIFPYMSYAFAMNQKVLRRVWNRDGAAGIALLLAAQFPIAMMVAASINVRKGEEPDKDLAMGTLRAMTALGIWNYPMELLMNGVGANGVTAMTPFSKTYNLVGDIISGDVTPRSIKENTVLNSAVFLDPLIAAMED